LTEAFTPVVIVIVIVMVMVLTVMLMVIVVVVAMVVVVVVVIVIVMVIMMAISIAKDREAPSVASIDEGKVVNYSITVPEGLWLIRVKSLMTGSPPVSIQPTAASEPAMLTVGEKPTASHPIEQI
jgi:hypothetical protein